MLNKVLMGVFFNQSGAFWFDFSLEACPTCVLRKRALYPLLVSE